ncbi:E3 binding domain-containing protein [Haloarchaeobius sp. HME9146]|uniref:E3 binding domain-containing protein n=1 Tax=Haloarchaeobius sp. HME9146 TaxID=2978732 RepID=UPI0021BE69B0|nr:E3 binding domain-containing protein [Haloarchaeobius sp. HME9146]MCT9098070.1 E3 binding domain-containing protein [Haloarchaeobius sp. HME9146]
MPKLGLEMEQGIILEWFFEPGEAVSEGDVIAEVESEKSIGEVEAREDGELRRIYLEEGESIPPGKPIGILAASDAEISDLEAEVEAELGDAGAAVDDSQDDDAAAETTDTDSAADTESTASDSGAAGDDVKASPRAKKQAEELGVDLTTVEGTGPMGSITADDVEAAASESDGQDSSSEPVKASPRAKKQAEELGVDLTTVEGTGPMGSITADDVEAAADAAQSGSSGGVHRTTGGQSEVYRYERLSAVANPEAGEALLETTEAVRSAFEERVTTTDVLLLVASAALEETPVLNGTYAESTHQLQTQQDIELVSDADDDLASGVIAGVDEKSLTEIVEARESLGDDEDDETASFTLSNTAGEDPDGPLINSPGVAALEIDPSGQRAVPNGDGVELQPLVTVDLTYDTCAIGDAEAEAFVDSFFEQAEQASELVLGSYRGKE